jgi:hypothetical protein
VVRNSHALSNVRPILNEEAASWFLVSIVLIAAHNLRFALISIPPPLNIDWIARG